jgi:Flp pilus assembly protein TadD
VFGSNVIERDGSNDSGTVAMNEAYERFMEGQELLSWNPQGAIVALERARELEPEQGSIREALARAYFRTRRFADAEAEFAKAVELDPVNDYAHFGLGLCATRAGDAARARGHLKLATVMRPDSEDYRDALARVTPAP